MAVPTLAAVTESGQTITINGQTVDKTATELTFDGDNVILHFNDGTQLSADMASVIAASGFCTCLLRYLTYKNITLNIRYTDDSLAKHRKAIAVALMNAGAVLKPRNPQAPASGQASGKEAVDGEKKKDLKENAETRTVK